MTVLAAELQAFQSANMPEDDESTSGGAINDAGLVTFTDIAATDNIEVLSDGADTREVTLTGRNSAGAIVSETLELDGANPVTSANQYERLLKATLSASSGARTVTIRRATGDTLIATLPPDKTSVRRLFYDAASEPDATTRYEKIFLTNTNGTDTLTNATVELTADPAATVRIGLATAKDDSGSVADRMSAPGGVAFVDDGVSQDVPEEQLEAGEAIGVWVEMQRGSSAAAIKNTFTVELAGTTT